MVDAFHLHERSPRLPASILVILLVVIEVGQRVVGTALQTYETTGEYPMWFPHLQSLGETGVVYATLFDFLTLLLLPAVLVWFGYALGRYHASRSSA